MTVDDRFDLFPEVIQTADIAAVKNISVNKTFTLGQIPTVRYISKRDLPLEQYNLILETNNKQAFTANFRTYYEGDKLYLLKVESKTLKNADGSPFSYFNQLIGNQSLGVDIPPNSKAFVWLQAGISFPQIFIALSPVYCLFQPEEAP